MYEITDLNYTIEPISTGAKNWTSSICVHLGSPPFKNRYTVNQPS